MNTADYTDGEQSTNSPENRLFPLLDAREARCTLSGCVAGFVISVSYVLPKLFKASLDPLYSLETSPVDNPELIGIALLPVIGTIGWLAVDYVQNM